MILDTQMVLVPHAQQAKLQLDKQPNAQTATQDAALVQHLTKLKFAHNVHLNMAIKMELAVNAQLDKHQEEHRLNA
jgi:hypothetical protein